MTFFLANACLKDCRSGEGYDETFFKNLNLVMEKNEAFGKIVLSKCE